MNNPQELYDKREKRVQSVIALKEPDRVPINALAQGYPVTDNGHTMAEAVYNFDIVESCMLKFAQKYDPDIVSIHNGNYWGMGKALELMQPTRLDWAGKPGGRNKENYIHQVIEFSPLEDEEIDEFNADYTSWMLHKGLPKVSKLLSPLANIWSLEGGPAYDISYLASEFSTPEFRNMMQTLWKINDLTAEATNRMSALDAKLNALGYLTPVQGYAAIPLDNYGAYLRGTQDCLMDLYENEDTILNFCERTLYSQIASIQAQGEYLKGKWAVFYLTKASDSFMGAEHFKKFYWGHLQTLIEEVLKCGMVPYVYTEGPFTSRLEFLKDVPKGVIYHFEDTVDMKLAKKLLGDSACIAGGFPIADLLFSEKQTVIDKAKALLDICAPGGGYIFETAAGFDEARRENVEALFETVKEYGKY